MQLPATSSKNSEEIFSSLNNFTKPHTLKSDGIWKVRSLDSFCPLRNTLQVLTFSRKSTLAAVCPYTTLFCSLAAVELTKRRHLVQFSTSSVFADDAKGCNLVSFDLVNLVRNSNFKGNFEGLWGNYEDSQEHVYLANVPIPLHLHNTTYMSSIMSGCGFTR